MGRKAGMSDDVAAFGAYALPPVAARLLRLSEALGRGPVGRGARSTVRRLVGLWRAGPFDVEPFPGQRARLYPVENLSDKRVFLAPGLWDLTERRAIGQVLRAAPEPGYFVDAGANMGLYTLAVRAELAGRPLRALAIEPDPENVARLRFNLAASGAEAEVAIAPVALSDRDGTLRITLDQGNRGALHVDPAGTPVTARPLLDLVREAGFPRVDALKIDIEGMELPVLRHYLGHAERALWPRLVVLEARPGARGEEETPALAHLRGLGYEVQERTRLNAVLRLPAGAADRIGVTGNAHGNQA
jgi:FkbM family methyltransferase